MENKKAKNKYIIFSILSYLIIILPVLIYNLCFIDEWLSIEDKVIKFTAVGLIALVMICIAILTKTKNKGNWYILFIGLILLLLNGITEQIGISLICIGVSMTLDMILFNRLAKHYKEIWYESRGKQVVHTVDL